MKKKILAMTPKEAREVLGIKHRSTLKRMKDRIKEGKKVNLKWQNSKNYFKLNKCKVK